MQIIPTVAANLSKQPVNTQRPAPEKVTAFADVLQQQRQEVAAKQEKQRQAHAPENKSVTLETPSAFAEFQAWLAKSPAERLREFMLAKMGLTEEDLANLDPEKIQQIEEQLSREIAKEIEREQEETVDILKLV